jgi:hypothetical protein
LIWQERIMRVDVKQSMLAMRAALRDVLPAELISEAFRDVFPREAIVEAFREGLALFFSPFAGFGHVFSTHILRRPPRRGHASQ